MTLRDEIHAALDEIAPPAPALAGQIAASIAPTGKGTRSVPRGRRNPWLVGLGRTGSLVAALLIVLLMATLVVGVHEWRDRNLLNTNPVAPSVDQVGLAQLEARPLRLPVVPPGGTCPNTPRGPVDYGISIGQAYGGGPVYVLGGALTTTKWGDYFDVTYLADPQLTGIVLVRIRDLESSRIGVFVGPYAAGSVVGTDTIDGNVVQQNAELVLDASHHPVRSLKSKWGIWNVRQGLAAGWSHCFGIQVDGAGFTEVFTGNG